MQSKTLNKHRFITVKKKYLQSLKEIERLRDDNEMLSISVRNTMRDNNAIKSKHKNQVQS